MPNPALLAQLPQKASAGKYQMMLPKDSVPVEPPPRLPSNLKSLSRWKQEPESGELWTFLAFAVFSDERLKTEALQNMRQTLVNNSAGLTDSLGIHIAKRDRTETGVLDGLSFTRFRWYGLTQNQTSAIGLVYGALDGENIITINAISMGTDEKPLRLLESSIAT